MNEGINLSNIEKQRMKTGKTFMFACMIFYILSVAVKGVFAAEVRYIIEIWGLTQAQVQLANTFYFIAYGAVQILLFVFMHKINIKTYVFITIPISCLMSIAMGLATNIKMIWVFFAGVGIFQAGMFCACNYLLTKYLPEKLLPTANKWIASSHAVGTAISYVITAFFVGLNLWRVPYFLLSGLLLISTVYLIYQTKVIAKFNKINKKLDAKQVLMESKQITPKDLPIQTREKPIFSLSTKKRKIMFYVIVLVFSLLVNGLYYGSMNFITSVLVDVYAFPQDASIYVSTVIPIIIILGPMLTINACEKRKNFVSEAIKFLLILLPFSIVLALFYKANAVLYILLIVVYLILANGIRVIINNVITFKLKDSINVASFSALTNAFASISASVWPLIIAFIKDNSNWAITYWTISILTGIIILLAVVINFIIKRMYKKDNDGEILR